MRDLATVLTAELGATPTADSFAGLARALVGEGVEGLDAFAHGELVDGAYRIEGRIGRGGMGLVYRARDLRLDRDVAIKIGLAMSDGALRRLRREAISIARMSHPNVVVVHEVGEIDGRVFIAMEHVGGGTARSFCARARSWREILAMYCAAGDGLAAAHAAGLVHRDFKPDNVLVGEDGRPRVADFGLVRGVAGDDDAGAG
ncbi:MAG TPA: serine/threonine-protein kinase, partial [Kofleriaceae bacterium]|nr:serine/threonine-protein kinase [Kofleriaceae bacterium]